jgi:hypothetical protein
MPPRNRRRRTWQGCAIAGEKNAADDVLELRSILDDYYTTNEISNKQLECLIEESDPQTAYFLMELLGERIICERTFDQVMKSRHNMRIFADTPQSEWYPDGRTGRINAAPALFQ